MDIREVQAYLGADWKALKETLAESLNSDIDLLNRTNQALLANGGKQLRCRGRNAAQCHPAS